MKNATHYYESNNTNFITKLFKNTHAFFYKNKIKAIERERFKTKVLNIYLEKKNRKFLTIEELEYLHTLKGTKFYKLLLLNLTLLSFSSEPFEGNLISFAHKKNMLQ